MKVKPVQQLHQAAPLLASAIEKLDRFTALRAKRPREPEGGIETAAPQPVTSEADSLLDSELESGLQALGDTLLEFRHQLAPSAELVAKRLISLLPSCAAAARGACRHRGQLWRCIAIFCSVHSVAGSRVLAEAIESLLSPDRSGSGVGALWSYLGEESVTPFSDALLASAPFLKSTTVQRLSHVVVSELLQAGFSPPTSATEGSAGPSASASLLSEHVEEVAHLTTALILSCRPLVPALLALGNRIVERCLACRETPVGASARAKVSLLQAVLRCVTLPDALPWYTSTPADVEGVVATAVPAGGSTSRSTVATVTEHKTTGEPVAPPRARGQSASPRLRPLGPDETTVSLRRSTPTVKPASVSAASLTKSTAVTAGSPAAALKPKPNTSNRTSTPRTAVTLTQRLEDAEDIPDIVLD